MIYLISQIIDRTAQTYPDKEAFRFEAESLTYAALVRRTNALAHTLVELGVKRGDRVGIYLHKSLESAIALYGILKAGAAYVPLDPLLPESRLAAIIRDCDIEYLVSQEMKRPILAKISQQETGLRGVIGLSDGEDVGLQGISWAQVEQAPSDSAPAVKIIEQDLAYIMYTSGSTGTPKGMMHTHHSGLSYAKLAAEMYDLRSTDRLSNFPPLHFDQSTFDYFSGPLVGATTVIIPEAYTKFPASLSQLMAEERLTVWYSVPFPLIQLLLRGVLEQRDMNALRWVLYGGEPFPPKYLAGLQKLWPGASFSNVYGPAEVNQCTFYTVPPLSEDSDAPIPIGKLWPNAEGLVVDEEDVPVAAGEVGELLVRTPTMMQGYWRRPDLNERAFFYREGAGGQRDRFYRTGDVVQTLPDGNLLFLGRKDRQVKVRGFRVELDEVEAALLSHPSVEETAVFPVPDGEGSHQVIAAIIAKPGQAINQTDLLQHAASRLPRYALPTKFDFREDFPRTSSGKIDRRALAAASKKMKDKIDEEIRV